MNFGLEAEASPYKTINFFKKVLTLSFAGLCKEIPVTVSNSVYTDYTKGFGGKFGVQTDRQDKCALGWDHQEKVQLHESQKGI